VAFPKTQALRIIGGGERGGKWTPLVYSSKTSFLETNLEQLIKYGRVHRDPEDPKGPLVLACAYSEQIAIKPWETGKHGGEIRIVFLGNDFFMRNMALEIYSNYLLAINIFNWATGEQEQAYISPKSRLPSRVFITNRQTQIIFYSSVLIIPEILCIIGLAIWWRRK